MQYTERIDGISIIIPAFNEEENIPILYEKIKDALKNSSFMWELIFIDDGSEDNTFSVLAQIAKKDKKVKVIRFRKNFGKGAAYSIGIKNARFPIIVTMDADLQDDPSEIKNLIEKLLEGYEYVSGWKSKNIISRIFNFILRKITRIPLHDFNCSFKVFYRDVIQPEEIYGQLFRFMPVIANSKGFHVTEIKVKNYPRLKGKSKYGFKKVFDGFFDILTISFLYFYLKKPLHLFGIFGLIHFIIGLSIVIGLYLRKLMFHLPIKDYPFLFIIAIFLMIAALQFIFVGLISELMIYLKGRNLSFYYVEKCINIGIESTDIKNI